MKTRVITVTCPSCKDEIYSRARHDFNRCKCGSIHIDGGFDYVKVGYKAVSPERHHRFVNASKQELYDDWNNRLDKFGRIDNNKLMKCTRCNGKGKYYMPSTYPPRRCSDNLVKCDMCDGKGKV